MLSVTNLSGFGAGVNNSPRFIALESDSATNNGLFDVDIGPARPGGRLIYALLAVAGTVSDAFNSAVTLDGTTMTEISDRGAFGPSSNVVGVSQHALITTKGGVQRFRSPISGYVSTANAHWLGVLELPGFSATAVRVVGAGDNTPASPAAFDTSGCDAVMMIKANYAAVGPDAGTWANGATPNAGGPAWMAMGYDFGPPGGSVSYNSGGTVRAHSIVGLERL